VRAFPFGRLELFELGGTGLGRAVYAPGWVWSQHVAPLAGTSLCQVEHRGLVLRGRAAVKMVDGTEVVLGPGDFFSIPPGHDSWVVGDEEYVSLHLAGAEKYARSSREAHAAGPG
jgi:quercetin dioxygenase-like cupin family protein